MEVEERSTSRQQSFVKGRIEVKEKKVQGETRVLNLGKSHINYLLKTPNRMKTPSRLKTPSVLSEIDWKTMHT